jgi:hypothetical protein
MGPCLYDSMLYICSALQIVIIQLVAVYWFKAVCSTSPTTIVCPCFVLLLWCTRGLQVSLSWSNPLTEIYVAALTSDTPFSICIKSEGLCASAKIVWLLPSVARYVIGSRDQNLLSLAGALLNILWMIYKNLYADLVAAMSASSETRNWRIIRLPYRNNTR